MILVVSDIMLNYTITPANCSIFVNSDMVRKLVNITVEGVATASKVPASFVSVITGES